MANSNNFTELWDRVKRALTTENFQIYGKQYDRRPLIRLANSLGGPPMRLLHWQRLAELGRVPHSDEGEAVEAISGIDRFGASKVEIFMLSHRWLRPDRERTKAHPDSLGNEKATVLNQFTLWRRAWVLDKHGFLPEIYYWIDYTCIDQSNIEESIAMLPIWIACCERFVRIETSDYDERMWCRIEPLLSYVFSFADHHLSIDLNFSYRWPYFGSEIKSQILDPRTGKTTDPEDMQLIAPLVELAIQTRPARVAQPIVCFDETTVRCYRL